MSDLENKKELTPEERRKIRKKQELRRKRRRKRRIYMGILAGMIVIALILLVILVKIVAGIVTDHKESQKTGQGAVSAESTEAVEASDTETETAAAAEETVTKANDGNIHLIMAGDIVLHDDLERLSARSDGTYDYTDLFKNVTDKVQSADLALINAETIIGGSELKVSGFPNFNASYELADAIADCGFNVVLSANNHANDKGEQGILNCLENWKRFPDIEVLGIHDSKEDAEEIYVYEQDGMKIAILNYTLPLNKSIESSSKSYLIDRMEEKRVRSDIQKAHELADFVIVCPHWGTECRFYIDDNQKKWAQIFLEEGVDLVLGTHTHVIGKIQTLTDEDTGHEMLVYYALGNFCGYISETGLNVQYRTIGSMAEVTIGKKEDGSVGILDYGIEPLICHISKEQDLATVIPYEYYTESLAEEHLAKLYTGKYSLEFIEGILDDNWGDLWRQ